MKRSWSITSDSLTLWFINSACFFFWLLKDSIPGSKLIAPQLGIMSTIKIRKKLQQTRMHILTNIACSAKIKKLLYQIYFNNIACILIQEQISGNAVYLCIKTR